MGRRLVRGESRHGRLRRRLGARQDRRATPPFIAGHDRVFPPGSRFQYNSGNTHVVAELLARVLDESLSDYLARKVWVPLGMEQSALWMLDGKGGLEPGSILATARDLHRFGTWVLASISDPDEPAYGQLIEIDVPRGRVAVVLANLEIGTDRVDTASSTRSPDSRRAVTGQLAVRR